jgi:hypothetical protein
MPLSMPAVRDDPQDWTPHVVHVARALRGAALRGGGGAIQTKPGNRDRISKPFKEPRNRLQAWRTGTTTLFDVPAREATKAGGIDS